MPSLSASTVFVVDDDKNMCESIEWTLRKVGHEVLIFTTAEECLTELENCQPACIVVDLLLPGTTGLKLCEGIEKRTDSAYLMISGHGDINSVTQVMKMGAVDFLEKPFTRESLVDAVHRAIDLTKKRLEQAEEEGAVAESMATLSPREKEVFECVAEGLVSKQIAARLGISPKTVDVHRSSISQKLHIESPTQLAKMIYLNRRRNERQTNQ